MNKRLPTTPELENMFGGKVKENSTINMLNSKEGHKLGGDIDHDDRSQQWMKRQKN